MIHFAILYPHAEGVMLQLAPLTLINQTQIWAFLSCSIKDNGKTIGCHRVMCTLIHWKQRKGLEFHSNEKILIARVMCTYMHWKQKERVQGFKAMKKDCLPQADIHSYALKTKKGFRVLRQWKNIVCHRVMCTHMHWKQRKGLGF
jgi:hypothetical protein